MSGHTIDYLTFEVTMTGPVRLIYTDFSPTVFLALGEIVPGDTRFNRVGLPYLLFARTDSDPRPPEFTRTLNPGTYVVQATTDDYRGGDLGDTFRPTTASGGLFTTAPYSFAIEGPIRGLEFLEGNLDQTFTVTQVPEPSPATLLFLAFATRLLPSRRAPVIP